LNATFCKFWQRGRIVKIALFQDEASEISLVPSQVVRLVRTLYLPGKRIMSTSVKVAEEL